MKGAGPLAILWVILICCPVVGATITVAPSGGDVTSLQEAVDRAARGDTIVVREGTYRERILIQRPLTLRAAGGEIPTIDPAGLGTAVTIRGRDVVLDGFRISGCGAFPGILIQSDGALITGTMVTGCGDGIRLEVSSNASIIFTTLTGNQENGIAFAGADNSIISRTTISGNGGSGVDIDENSDGNRLYLNNFQNDQNVKVSSTTTEWSSPDPIRYEYGGTVRFSRLGNYWNDYDGSDADRDGIGDTPYLITEKRRGNAPLKSLIQQAGKRDLHPLMEHWEVLVPATPVPTTTRPLPTTTLTLTPSPTSILPTSVVTPTTLPAEDTSTSRPGLPLLLFIPAVLGTAYLALRTWQYDQGENWLQFSHLQGLLLGVGHTVSGGGLFILSYLLIEAALLRAVTFGRYVVAVVALGILILFISFSGFILAYNALKRKGVLLLSRVHIIIAILPLSLSLIISIVIQGKDRVPLLAIGCLSAVSFLMAIWQYLHMVGGGKAGKSVPFDQGGAFGTDTITGQQVGVTGTEPGTVFPMELRERYSDPVYVGKGGIARVFRARRREDGISVAVKIPVSFDEATGRSFLKEMRIWEDLHHPNIVEITAVNILPIPFVEMTYYTRSLGELEMPLQIPMALSIIQGIAEGLLYAHEKGVIHRDLKPQNILLTDDFIPKISDWGLSRTISHETAASLAGFSLPYAAPEQLSPLQFGETDERTDIYQLGVIFYQVLTGKLPFEGQGMYDISSAIINKVPLPPAAFNEELVSLTPLVLRCLEKEMKNRYQSITELQRDLVPFLDMEKSDEGGKQ